MSFRPLLSRANLHEADSELRRLEMTIDCKSSDSSEQVVDHVFNFIALVKGIHDDEEEDTVKKYVEDLRKRSFQQLM